MFATKSAIGYSHTSTTCPLAGSHIQLLCLVQDELELIYANGILQAIIARNTKSTAARLLRGSANASRYQKVTVQGIW
ncbi:hypothetical protein PTI98_013194 [Pleurotus ostreatus]|nr:hypothetical protein PTI98_013194 [Pleurotus ostreatus]